MKNYGNYLKRTEVSHLSLFCGVFGLSSIAIVLCGKNAILQSAVFDRNILSLFQLQGIDRVELFLYVLRERCFIIPCLFLLATTYLGKGAGYLVCAWYGAGLGTITGVVMLRYGLGGIFLLLGSAFPQYLFYVPVFLMTIRIMKTQKRLERKYLVQLLLTELVVMLGCVAESFVNPQLMEKIIKFFV